MMSVDCPLFLMDVAECLRQPGLFEVQKVVFNHFKSIKFSTSPIDTINNGNVSCGSTLPTCICNLKPDLELSISELLFYKEMLSKVAESDNNPDAREVDRLNAIHKQIVESQNNVKNALQRCQACCHGILFSSGEQFVHNVFSERLQLNVSYYNYYGKVLTNKTEPLDPTVLCWTDGKEWIMRLPNLTKLDCRKAGYGLENGKDASNFDSCRNPRTFCSAVEKDSNIIFLPSSVLYVLFCKHSFPGLLLPFVVADQSLAPSCEPSVVFEEPIVWSPLLPRDRAKTFYEHLVKLECYSANFSADNSDQPLSPDGSKAPASARMMALRSFARPQDALTATASKSDRSHSTKGHSPISTASSPKSSPRVTAKPSQSTEASSPATGSRQTVPSQPTSASRANSRRSTRNSSLPIAFPRRMLRSSRSGTNASHPGGGGGGQLLLTSTVAGEAIDDDDADETVLRLSIDVDCQVEASQPSPSEMSKVASSCVVVEPTQKTKGLVKESISELSDPASPQCSEPPASPSLQERSVGEAAISVNLPSDYDQPKVIPLESSNSADVEYSDPAGTGVGPYAYSTLAWGRSVSVVVQLEDTRWSERISCPACSSPQATAACPSWPCCSSRSTVGLDKQSTSKRIFVQVKPEYLSDWGCECLTSEEIAAAWLGSTLRKGADILRLRIAVNSGELIWAEHQTRAELLASYPHFSPGHLVGHVEALFKELLRLPPGAYLLSSDGEDSSPDAVHFTVHSRVSTSALAASETVDWSSGLPKSFSLEQVHDRFVRASRPLVARRLTADTTSSLVAVHRLPLDLDLPAGREETVVGTRSLRLPALPIGRVKVSQLTNQPMPTSATESTQAKRSTNGRVSKRSAGGDHTNEPKKQQVTKGTEKPQHDARSSKGKAEKKPRPHRKCRR